jgi:hypothetical protein
VDYGLWVEDERVIFFLLTFFLNPPTYRNSVGKFVVNQIILWLIVAFFLLLFVGVLRTKENVPCVDPSFGENPEIEYSHLGMKTDYSPLAGENWSKNSYGICFLQWHGLNIVDYGLMANLAYFTKEASGCSEKVSASLAQWFPNDPWKVVGGQKKGMRDFAGNRKGDYPCETVDLSGSLFFRLTFNLGDVLGFLHIYNPARSLSIITVRGTVPTRATDILQDFDLFKEVLINCNYIIWMEAGCWR